MSRSNAVEVGLRWLEWLCMGGLIALPALLLVGQAGGDIALSTIAVLFLVRSALARDWAWLAEPWVLAGLVVWIYLMINAGLVADNTVAANTRAQPFGRFIVFGAALQFWLFLKAPVRRGFLIVLGVVIAFVVIDCLIQFFAGEDLFGRPSEAARLTGPFEERVPGGFLARMSLPLVAIGFAWAATSRGAARVLGVVAATVVLAVTIAFTGERAALVMYAFGVFLLFLFLPGARRPLFTTGVAGLLVLVVAVSVHPTLSERLVGHTTRDFTNFWDRRIGSLLERGFAVFEEQPLFGVGLKNFRQECARDDFLPRGRVETRCYTHPHQIWNEWLAETGLVGFSGFVLLQVLWIARIVRGLRRLDGYDYALALGAALAIVVFLWPLRTSMSFFTNWIGAMLWPMIGLALALAAPRGRPPPG